MKSRVHGIISISLIILASITGIVSIIHKSWVLAIIYMGIIIAGWMIVIGTFCVKCPCRLGSCAHYLPGRITALFPEKKPGPYSIKEMIIIGLALASIFLYPQYWLWKEKILFTAFWALIMIAIMEITLFVCKECTNRYCPNYR